MGLDKAIRNARQKSFYTQEAFAKELNVAVSTVNRWETGKSKPNLSAMKALKDFCESHSIPYDKIESEWLILDDNDKEQ